MPSTAFKQIIEKSPCDVGMAHRSPARKHISIPLTEIIESLIWAVL